MKGGKGRKDRHVRLATDAPGDRTTSGRRFGRAVVDAWRLRASRWKSAVGSGRSARPPRRAWSSSSSTASRRGRNESRFPRAGQAGGDFHDVATACGRRGPSSARSSSAARPTRSNSDDERHLRLQGASAAQGAVDLGCDLRGRVCRGRARSRRSWRRPVVPGRPGAISATSAARRTISRSTRACSCSTSRSSTSPTGERSTTTFTKAAGWWSRRVIAACPRATTTRSPASFCPRSSATSRRPRRRSATFGKVANITHPLFQRYGKDLDTVLAMVPVYRYWPVKQPAEGTRTLLNYSDGAPALMERTFKGPKTGRVLLWTTPLSRRPDVGGALRAEPERLERVSRHDRLVVPGPHEPDGPLPGRHDQRTAQFRGGRECAFEAGADRTVHEASW